MADMAQIQGELHTAISDVLTKHGLYLNRWLLVTEVVEADGDRSLNSFASPDLRAWDSLGMLEFALAQERGALFAEAADEGPE